MEKRSGTSFDRARERYVQSQLGGGGAGGGGKPLSQLDAITMGARITRTQFTPFQDAAGQQPQAPSIPKRKPAPIPVRQVQAVQAVQAAPPHRAPPSAAGGAPLRTVQADEKERKVFVSGLAFDMVSQFGLKAHPPTQSPHLATTPPSRRTNLIYPHSTLLALISSIFSPSPSPTTSFSLSLSPSHTHPPTQYPSE